MRKDVESIVTDEKEIWKPIDWISNLRGTYEISNKGRIKCTSNLRYNIKRKEHFIEFCNRILVPNNNGHGYLQIGLSVDTPSGRKKKNFYIHRLVATAFLSNPENKPEVNHKDYNRNNNNADNLEWVTDAENVNHSVCNLRHPRTNTSGIRFKDKRYEVSVYHDKKQFYVGRYDTYDKALAERNKKLKELGVEPKWLTA